jgi:hypothetical protein
MLIYFYLPTCFGRFCDHHRGVIQESIYLSGFITAVAVFRKPNAIPLCFSIDLVLNFLLSYKNTNNIQTVAQNVQLKPLSVGVNILSASYVHKMSNYFIVTNR